MVHTRDLEQVYGSYKQQLLEFEAFQGFSRTNITIFRALLRHEVVISKTLTIFFKLFFSNSGLFKALKTVF